MLFRSMAQRIAVMYAGQIMEERATSDLFADPHHPYTEALMAAMPERSNDHGRLSTIPGMVPGIYDRPAGCLFAPRCAYAQDDCRATRPLLEPRGTDGSVRCLHPLSHITAALAQAA